MSLNRQYVLDYVFSPAILLSESHVVISANEGMRRLTSLRLVADKADPLVGQSILRLGISLVSEQKPVLHTWDSLLDNLAVEFRKRQRRSYSATENGDLKPPENGLASYGDDYEVTDRFWDSEHEESMTKEMNVYVVRRGTAAADHDVDGAEQSISMVKARLRAHALLVDDVMCFILRFNAPRTAQHQLTCQHGDRPPPLIRASDLDVIKDIDTSHGNDRPDVHHIINKLMPHVLGLLDKDGQVEFLSQSWYDYTGLSERQSFGSEYAQTIHPDDLESMMNVWKEVVRVNGDHWNFEARYKRYDGEYRYFLVRSQAVKDENGVVLRYYASMIDIHELALARIEADRRTNSILALLSHTDVSLWEVDQARQTAVLAGHLDLDLDRIANPTGDTPQKLGSDLSTPEGDMLGTEVHKALAGRRQMKILEHKAGDRWYRTRLLAVKKVVAGKNNDKPGVQAVLGLTLDVTDMKAGATLMVENEKLMANEVAAKDASNLKSQFLANMSHEIRTPIAGILDLNEILSGTSLDAEQQELCQGVASSASFLLTIVNDILDFSKIESGHMDIESVPFKLSALIHDLLQIITFRCSEKGLALNYKNSFPADQVVIGDPSRIRQILTNLLGNSIKFTREGSITLTVNSVETSRLLSPRNDTGSPVPTGSNSSAVVLQFLVEDTGIGISKDAMRKLFRPFNQADSSTSRNFGGTGLGLTISKQLVELMGGTITLESAPSKGSIATVHLPVQLSNSKKNLVSVNTASAAVSHHPSRRLSQTTLDKSAMLGNPTPIPMSISTPSIRPSIIHHSSSERHMPAEQRMNIHILVVEDNVINSKIALLTIRKMGFTATAVWNGQEALEYLSEAAAGAKIRPDIVLMDCMMPVMDGYQATDRIRHDVTRFGEDIRRLPIIAMTASAIQGDKEKCVRAGMDDYLSKPVVKTALEMMLVKYGRKYPRPSQG